MASEVKQEYRAIECEVWNREKSFSASVENHDAKTFAEHLETSAVFNNGDGSSIKGRGEITKEWVDIIEGPNLVLRWHPDFVSVSSDGKTAVSRGPYWMENPNPEAKRKFMIGMFQSTWVKNTKGQGHMFVDGGTPGPTPATPEQLAALKHR